VTRLHSGTACNWKMTERARRSGGLGSPRDIAALFRQVKVTARSTPTRRAGLDGHVNYTLVMRNERDDLVAIGPVSIEYQAAMIRDELEESAGWTTAGIARVLTEEQARTIAAAAGG
jgi:hypothetical protein